MESREIIVKVFGYQKDNEELIELREVSFQCDIEELEKVIKFLQETKKQHSKIIGEVELCHSHFRDWDINWKDNGIDIIVVTTSKTR